MKFTKMHGIGNDYIYVNGFVEQVADPAATAVAMSRRHFGIGADGLILVLPSDRADVRMRMFNADGSEAEMCGNGIRCVAKFAYERGLSRANPMRVEAGAGVLTLTLAVEDGKVSRVTVDMGEPILEAGKIPTTLGATGDRVVNVTMPAEMTAHLHKTGPAGWMDACALEPAITCVSMGNPHAVVYCRQVERVPLAAVGPLIERDGVFPRRTNVHFVQADGADHVVMRTWERGSGITLACGTGACAVCVAGVLTGKSAAKITARLPGGELQLDWSSGRGVMMTGPATEVFSGEWGAR
jgi:diaminopimelate epimerase